jgi:hypothetical protein
VKKPHDSALSLGGYKTESTGKIVVIATPSMYIHNSLKKYCTGLKKLASLLTVRMRIEQKMPGGPFINKSVSDCQPCYS